MHIYLHTNTYMRTQNPCHLYSVTLPVFPTRFLSVLLLLPYSLRIVHLSPIFLLYFELCLTFLSSFHPIALVGFNDAYHTIFITSSTSFYLLNFNINKSWLQRGFFAEFYHLVYGCLYWLNSRYKIEWKPSTMRVVGIKTGGFLQDAYSNKEF